MSLILTNTLSSASEDLLLPSFSLILEPLTELPDQELEFAPSVFSTPNLLSSHSSQVSWPVFLVSTDLLLQSSTKEKVSHLFSLTISFSQLHWRCHFTRLHQLSRMEALGRWTLLWSFSSRCWIVHWNCWRCWCPC